MAYTQNINEVNAVAALVNALVVGGYGNVAAGADASANFWIYEAVQNLATFLPASVSATITPAAIATVTTAEQTFNPAGFASLKAGDAVIVTPPAAPTAGTSIGQVRVSATGTLAVTFINPTAGSLTPAAGVYKVTILRS